MNDRTERHEFPLEADHSRYELVMIAAREARRLNEKARDSGKELKRRVTEVAWERLRDGKIQFTYTELPPEAEAASDEAPDLIPESAPAAGDDAGKQEPAGESA